MLLLKDATKSDDINLWRVRWICLGAHEPEI